MEVPQPFSDSEPVVASDDSELESTVPVEVPPDTEVTVIEEEVPVSERAAMLARYGGTEESEAAVSSALKWLATHQLPDGSWCFNHRGPHCQGLCNQPGNMPRARVAATGMAVMTLLGAGNSRWTADRLHPARMVRTYRAHPARKVHTYRRLSV